MPSEGPRETRRPFEELAASEDGPDSHWRDRPLVLCSPGDAGPPAVDARFVRAHPDSRDPHAERRARVAGRQSRSPSRSRRRRPDSRAVVRAPHRRGSDRPPPAGSRRPLGDDLSTRHRAPADRAHSLPAPRRAHRRWRLRSEPGSRRVGPSGSGRGRDRAWRGRRDVPRGRPGTRERTAAAGGTRSVVSRRRRLPPHGPSRRGAARSR